jgi:glycosyltransferase involved in cell wall biosynthesis
MRIGFVAEPYEESHASGMGYVVRELMRNFPQEGATHEFVFFSSKPISRSLIPGAFENILIPKGYIQKFFYFFFFKEKVDALIFMVPMLPLFYVGGGTPTFPMCQELASQKIKPGGLKAQVFAYVRDQICMPIVFKRAVHVIAASGATRDDIIRFYTINPAKITVAYDGFRDLREYADGSYKVGEEMKPYFFFTGKVKYRKNVHGIVSAFIAFKERTQAPVKLVISGDYGGNYYENMLRELTEHHLEHEVFFLGYTTDAMVYELYKNALACVFPSINEGFGMPIVEAMSLGTPVLTSNISSMAEVAGDAAVLVDPFSVEDITQGMEALWSDETLRQHLVEKSKARVALFSWPKAAREYIEIVRTHLR